MVLQLPTRDWPNRSGRLPNANDNCESAKGRSRSASAPPRQSLLRVNALRSMPDGVNPLAPVKLEHVHGAPSFEDRKLLRFSTIA